MVSVDIFNFLHMWLFIAGSCQSTAFSSRTSVSVRDEAEYVHVPGMKLQLTVFRYRKLSYIAIRKMWSGLVGSFQLAFVCHPNERIWWL